jgi:HEAT repeat protein
MTAAQRLRAPDVAERLAAMTEVAAQGSADADTLEALAACLGDTRKIIQRRAAESFAALDARGAEVRDVLMQTLAADPTRLRWGAAYALSLLGQPPPVALPILLDALGSDDGDVRWAAGNILARFRGDAAVVNALLRLLTSGTPTQRKMAAYCLRDLDARSAEVERALLEALHDADAYVRLAAMAGLARLAIDRAAVGEHVINLLSDPQVSVRRVAAAVLGLLGERSAAVLAALRAASTSSDDSLQRAAARALQQLAQLPQFDR